MEVVFEKRMEVADGGEATPQVVYDLRRGGRIIPPLLDYPFPFGKNSIKIEKIVVNHNPQ